MHLNFRDMPADDVAEFVAQWARYSEGQQQMALAVGASFSPPPGPELFQCPACDTTSPSVPDRIAGYCGRCHWFTGNRQLAAATPELFTTHGKPPPVWPGESGE
jgi:hypothetical protein